MARNLCAGFLGLAGILPVHPESYLIASRNRAEVERLKEEGSEVPTLVEPGFDKEYFTTPLDVATQAKQINNKWKY